MNQKAKDQVGEDGKSTVEPISSPSSLELNPKPPQPRRVSKRAAGAIGVFALLLLVAFAYGGYKRTKTAQARVEQASVPRALSPATSAGNEFVNAIPPGNAAVRPARGSGQLVAPISANAKDATVTNGCGVDPRTNQPFRFDPNNGSPCNTGCGADPKTGHPYRYDPNTGALVQATKLRRLNALPSPGSHPLLLRKMIQKNEEKRNSLAENRKLCELQLAFTWQLVRISPPALCPEVRTQQTKVIWRKSRP